MYCIQNKGSHCSPQEGVERGAPLLGDFRVIVCPNPPQMNDYCDLLGTPGAPVSKIASVNRNSPRLKIDSSDYSREFMMVLYVMSNGTPEENLIQIFRIFDINTDGLLSPKEVEKVVKYLFKIFPQKEYPDQASQKVLAKNAFEARSIIRGV